MIDHNQVTLYGRDEGLAIGNVLSLFVQGVHVWAAGDTGIAYLASNNRFVAFHADGNNSLRGISGIVETAPGDLWLNSPDGVYRITANQIDALLRSPGYQPSYKLFTQAMASMDNPSRSGPDLLWLKAPMDAFG